MAASLLALYRREPARFNGLIASGVAVLLVRVGLDIRDADVLAAVAFVVPLLAAEATRRLVTPVAGLPKAPWAPPEDWSPANPDVRKPKA